MSLIYPHETEDIILPSRIKAVRDLHISPFDRSLAVFASLGKTLSVLRQCSQWMLLFLFPLSQASFYKFNFVSSLVVLKATTSSLLMTYRYAYCLQLWPLFSPCPGYQTSAHQCFCIFHISVVIFVQKFRNEVNETFQYLKAPSEGLIVSSIVIRRIIVLLFWAYFLAFFPWKRFNYCSLFFIF